MAPRHRGRDKGGHDPRGTDHACLDQPEHRVPAPREGPCGARRATKTAQAAPGRHRAPLPREPSRRYGQRGLLVHVPASHNRKNIPLTLGDLMSPTVATARGLHRDEPVLLGAVVAKHLPKQEADGPMDRAMGLMKKRGVREDLPTLRRTRDGSAKGGISM